MIRKKAHDELRSARPPITRIATLPKLPLHLIADNIRSIYNVGSIFRSADAAGIDKLHLCGITPYPPRKEISKTALGAENSVKWQYHEDIYSLLETLKSMKIPIIALEHTDRSADFQHFDYPFPLALILGNETEGLSEGVLPYIDHAVEIPMAGIKQSLNVAVAAGIILYELRRQFAQFP